MQCRELIDTYASVTAVEEAGIGAIQEQDIFAGIGGAETTVGVVGWFRCGRIELATCAIARCLRWRLEEEESRALTDGKALNSASRLGSALPFWVENYVTGETVEVHVW